MNSSIIVVGGGGAGLSIVSTIIDLTSYPIIWIDPTFCGGRLSKFPSVPSNTKVSLFQRFINFRECFGGNFDGFGEFNPEEGCELRFACEMVKSLSNHLREKFKDRLTFVEGWVRRISWIGEGMVWDVSIERNNKQFILVTGQKVIFATGSFPKQGNPTTAIPIDPEVLLNINHSSSIFSPSDTVAIIGGSHTAILILKNICNLPLEDRPKKLINIYHSPLRFAEYLGDGRIKFDNSGLKGVAAEWAKNYLDDRDGLDNYIERVKLDDSFELPDNVIFNKIVWAIGYQRNPLPIVTMNDDNITIVDYDDEGNLIDNNGNLIPQLYGIGIAFPQRVIDLSGNQEEAVGLWKFMQTASKMVTAWKP